MTRRTGHRRGPAARAGLVGVALLAGCTYANDHFGGDGASASATTTAASAGSGATTAATTDETTAATGATTAATTMATTATTTATTSATATMTGATTTDASTTEGSGSTEGGPTDCWGSVEWTIEPVDVAGFVEPSALRVSPDGLGLVYTDLAAGVLRPHQSARAALDLPFPPGQPIAAWAGFAGDARDGVLAPSTEELLLSVAFQQDSDADIALSSLEEAVWSLPGPIDLLLSAGPFERGPQLFDGGRRLYFSANRGPLLGEPLSRAADRIYQASRPDGAPGTAFEQATELLFPDLFPADTEHLARDPAPSADGLHLFFATTYPGGVTKENVNDALDIFYVERASLDDDWLGAVKVDALDAPGVWSSPESVTADGCQLFFRHEEPFGEKIDVPLWVGLRTPGS